MNIKYLATTLAVTGSLLLAGCGDSGDSSTNGSRVSGTVTSVSEGSVTVADIEFDSSSADIDSDGDTDDIYPGMHVYVDGDVDGNTGVAHKITYDSEIEGVVMAHDSVDGTMTVMGQAVSYNVDTIVFDDDHMGMMDTFDPATIVPGNVVEVSGNLVNGVVEATRIEYEGDSLGVDEDVEIKGYISNYNPDLGTFSIGGCEVTISETNPTTEIEDNVVLADNALVEVESSQELLTIDMNSQPQTCAMVAVEIENEDDEDDYDDIDDDHDDDDLS